MEIKKTLTASKSSFLGRLTKSFMSEGSHKCGSNVVHGYIFYPDDSISKSSKSEPEEPSVPETIIQQKSRTRRAPAKFAASQSQCNYGFDILQGYVQGLSDTWTFLTSLAKLEAVHDSENSMEKKSMREHKAAGGLFIWEVAYICFPRLFFL
uniref:L-arabinokinase n=1 Tax=Noccaea caerulescens TaxID=107243 RepID=A0A1J3JTL3_NOCCA